MICKYRGCLNLKSIELSDNLSLIAVDAFYGCSSLASIVLPPSIKNIYAGAFANCTSLASITIPEGVTAIEWETFFGCRKLSSVELPSTITSIGFQAFHWCFDLTTVVAKMLDPCEFERGSSFGYISNDCVLYVPAGTRDAYIAAGWTEDVFKGGVVEMNPTSVNSIEAEATKDGDIYDLTGRRIAHKPAHGFYIQNGWKYLVR